jgi:hypothetical protein
MIWRNLSEKFLVASLPARAAPPSTLVLWRQDLFQKWSHLTLWTMLWFNITEQTKTHFVRSVVNWVSTQQRVVVWAEYDVNLWLSSLVCLSPSSVIPFSHLAVSCSSPLSPVSPPGPGLVGPVTVSLPFRYESSSELAMKIGVSLF